MKTKEVNRIIFIIALVIICQIISYYGHFIYKTEIAYTHFFYVPIMFASIWWGYKGLVIPVSISFIIIITHWFSGMDWHLSSTIFRIFMFLFTGILVSVLSNRRIVLLKKLNLNREILEAEILERKKIEEELVKHKKNLEELVKERTSELNENVIELERLNNLFAGREFRIKELRDEIEELKNK